jgi:SNF2 family DNA or RNA helicase
VIEIRQDGPGYVTIDFAEEPKFDSRSHGVQLSLGLFVTEANDSEIVVEDGGQLGSVLEYIANGLTNLGFPFQFDPALERTLNSFRSEQTLVDATRLRKRTFDSTAPAKRLGLRRALLPHQRKALQHALRVQHPADFSVPGSGKTATALAVFAALRQQGVIERLMVIGPASSFEPWETEFAQSFGRKPKSVRLVGTRTRRTQLLQNLRGVDLVLCTYQMAYRERDSLIQALRTARYLLVLDESHHTKNINLGPWAQTVLDLAPYAERRTILTGTPAPKSLLDLWPQFTFLWPSQSLLGNRVEFEQRINTSANPADELKRLLKPFFVRTKKSDLNLPAPSSIFTTIPYKDVPPRQRLIIRLLELQTLQEAKNLPLSGSDISILSRWRKARTLRLLQAASNPALLTDTLAELGEFGAALTKEPELAALLRNYSTAETPAKVSFVVNTVRKLVGKGRKVVVWATFVKNILLLEHLLRDLNPLKIYGDIPAYNEDSDPAFENRERNISQFKTRKDRPILIANPAACSESISLHTACHDAVYLERTFNCGQFLQSMDRIHRVGMPKGTRTCYHIPLIQCAIEQVVDRRLRARQRVLYHLMDDDMPIFGYDDDSFLIDREDDLEQIFGEVLRAIRSHGKQRVTEPARRPRQRR